TPIHAPAPPASASVVAPSQKGFGATDTTRSDIGSPRDPRPTAGLEQRFPGSSGDYKMPGTAEAAALRSQATTPPAPTNPFASPSWDIPARGNLPPRASSGLTGSTQ